MFFQTKSIASTLVPKLLHNQTRRQIEERFISLVQSCKNLENLHQIQAQTITHGFFQSPFLAPKVIIAFFHFQNPNLALQSFQQIQQPNAVLWNVMFKGYTEIDLHTETLRLFVCMRKRDVRPNEYTFTFVIKSCARTLRWREGEEVHCFAIKTGYESNGFVGTTLIDMYSSVDVIESARKVFYEMPERNVVAWTCMVSAYISIGDLEMAGVIFEWANERDAILWTSMISGYIERGNIEAARELFDRMPGHDRDVMTWNTILLGYSNSGDIEACERFFEEMPEKNVFSWNGLIGGYLRRGWFLKVLCVFDRMLRSPRVMLNDATLVAVLSACAKLGAVNIGRWIHVFAETSGFSANLYVANGLIDMYLKCGCIMDAMLIFRRMETKDVVTMNVMIGGLATHGCGLEALELFEQMLQQGERPDGITFVGALSACVHAGMVEKGYSYFRLMTEDYLITPWIEHYGCMVVLLGRAGLLNEAIEFARRMPMEPDCVVWSALLGVCQVHNDVRLAKLVMNKIIKLDPEDVTNYVVLSNIYGAVEKWREVAGLKCLTRNSGNAKLPGCSFVEVGFQVVEFYSFDERHCKTSEIYQALHGLKELLKSAGCELDVYEAYE
ncbi:putative tetratricopeptide-like helical domain superfamily [Dioscorea sansibarensis]